LTTKQFQQAIAPMEGPDASGMNGNIPNLREMVRMHGR
jgi:hypothetical protein